MSPFLVAAGCGGGTLEMNILSELFFPYEAECCFLSYTSLAESSISCKDWMYSCSGPDPAI